MVFQSAVLDQRRMHQLAGLLLVMGLLVRGYYYLGNPSLWWDEAAIMLNVQDKNYAELAGPLDYAQSGPPFFLWLEKGLVACLGDSPWVWRGPALAASCLGLVVFFLVARRILPAGGGKGVGNLLPDFAPRCEFGGRFAQKVPDPFSPGAGCLWAVGLFAFSDRLLWHTIEVKPYTLDTLVAVGVLGAWLWTETWPAASRMLLFALLCPLCLCLSYPAMFVCCGPALVLLADAWKSRRVGTMLAYGLFLGTMTATGAWLALGPAHAQQSGLVAAGFTWSNQMPDWTALDRAAVWPVKAVFEVLRYCLYPTGGLLMVVAAGGALWLIRNRQQRLVVVLLTPLLASMAAACCHRYPVGCARPMLFMTSAASLLIGAATPPLLRWCRDVRALGVTQVTGVAVAMLALSPMAFSLSHLVVPWQRADCRGAAAYVLSHRQPEDLVVMTSWDQLYFYRDLDDRWRCDPDRLNDGDATRCWLTLGYPPYLAFERKPGAEKIMAGENGWTVAERQSFGELTLVLLERSASGERRASCVTRERLAVAPQPGDPSPSGFSE